MRNKSFLALLALLAFFADFAEALPAYRRLFEKTYGYKVSCLMCHSKGGGSALSPFGMDFHKAGTNTQAFRAIASKDSDGDLASNGLEIEKKSNPSDSASSPDHPGDWLAHVEALALPVDHLELLFPGIKKFSAVEGALFPDQVTSIESKLGAALSETDKLPTFYFAVSGEGKHAVRTGVAMFSNAQGPRGSMVVATAVDLSGRLTGVRVFAHAEGAALHGESFAKQFAGKTLKDPLSIGQDLRAPEGVVDAAVKVAQQVKKALLTIQSVFARKKNP